MSNKGGYIGIQTIRAVALNPDGTANTTETGLNPKDPHGIYTVSISEDLGVAAATIQGLGQQVQKLFGNNAVAAISVGKANPTVQVTINALNHFILSKLLGREADGKGGFDIEGKPVDVAIDVISTDYDGNDIHFCFYKGYFTQTGDIALATDTENQTQVHDQITLSPMANDNRKYGKIFYSGDEGFDIKNLEDEFFPLKPATPAPTPNK